MAPSIRKAHVRVALAWYVSMLHSALLVGLALHLFLRDEPAWFLGTLSVVGVVVVPLLGRAAYRGNSFSALLLLLTVAVPPAWAFLAGLDLAIPLAGLLFAPVYFFGVKGATGLRGRRASRAASGRSGPADRGRDTSSGSRRRKGARP